MKSRASLIATTVVITAIATSIIWIGLFLVMATSLNNSPPFAVTIDAPHNVRLREEFTLNAVVANPTDGPLNLGSIDFYDSLLDGFAVVSVDPQPSDKDHLFGFLSLYFYETIEPGDSFNFSMRLRAKDPGVWTGDVDFCTPSEDFMTSQLTIRVADE